jgi:hypothetical protein
MWADEMLKFLKSKKIKQLVHDADIGCCHEDCVAIEKKIKELQEIKSLMEKA